MAPRLALNAKELTLAAAALKNYLGDRSSIVRTCALQALSDLAEQSPERVSEVTELLHQAARTGTAAMKARSRKLLLRLEQWRGKQ